MEIKRLREKGHRITLLNETRFLHHMPEDVTVGRMAGLLPILGSVPHLSCQASSIGFGGWFVLLPAVLASSNRDRL
jgi:hypothetical protein